MTTPLDDMLNTDAPFMLSETEREEITRLADTLEGGLAHQMTQVFLCIDNKNLIPLGAVIRAGIKALSDES